MRYAEAVISATSRFDSLCREPIQDGQLPGLVRQGGIQFYPPCDRADPDPLELADPGVVDRDSFYPLGADGPPGERCGPDSRRGVLVLRRRHCGAPHHPRSAAAPLVEFRLHREVDRLASTGSRSGRRPNRRPGVGLAVRGHRATGDLWTAIGLHWANNLGNSVLVGTQFGYSEPI